jgi:hypothetical protein
MSISNSPDITLVFSGLFLFAFAEENGFCQIGIMEAERHCLKIGIKTEADSLPNSPGFLFEVSDGDIYFEVPNRPKGVDTYEPGSFDRDTAQDSRDFRWVLDFEGRELHDRRLPLKAGSLKRSIFVSNGLFYTHDKQDVRIQKPLSTSTKTAKKVGGENQLPLYRNSSIGDSIGCDIYLGDKEEFLFRYGPSADYSIRLKKCPNTSYKISVENLCPRESQIPAGSSDFAFYYKVVDVPENQQFRVLPPAVVIGVDDDNPCNNTRLSLSRAPLG